MINFLTGIDVLGNIDLNQNQLIAPRIENLTADPSGTEGQLYFNSSTDKLRLYANGAWTSLETTSSDDNTTYDLNGIGSSNATIGISLTGSDASQDDVLFTGAGTTVMTRSGNTLTITSNDQYDGTVTSVATTHGGNAFTAAIGGSSTVNPSVDITMAGASTDYINGLGNLVALSTLPSGSWTLDATTGTPQTIASGDTATFVGSTGISTSIQAADQVTITNTLPFNSITLSGTTGTSSTIVNSGSITITAGTNMTTVGNGSGGVTVNYTGGTGTMSSFIAAGDSGTSQTISNGNTLLIKGGSYITTTASSTDVIQVDADATTTATASKLVARDASGYGFVLTPNSGDSSTKIATTAFVQAAVTGLLEFKGGFNASTGAIVGGGNLTSGATRVAVSVGDYYVVTVAGDFFGNASTPLTPGDSVIVQTAATVGTSVEGDFIVVQSDTDLATLTTVGIGNVNAGAGIGVAYVSGTATVTNSSPNVDQNIWATFTATTGTTTANTTTDTLSVFGLGSITTSISGDTLSISGTDTTYSAMTTSNLGLGKLRYSVGSTPAAQAQTTTASRTYGITKNASDQLVVNVPWINTNTQTVTSVDETTPGTSTGTPIVVNPTTGNVLVKSMAYDGTTKVGHVPTGGSATTFLRGDGTWVVPTDSTPVDSVTASTNNALKGLSTSPTVGNVIVGLDLAGLPNAGVDLVAADRIVVDTATGANISYTMAAVKTYVEKETTYTAAYPTTPTDTWTIANSGGHGLGTGPFIIQTYVNATGVQVFIDTTVNPANGLVTMSTTNTLTASNIRVVMMKVS
jgi:hypothetical protein